jgi:hypothetical protein
MAAARSVRTQIVKRLLVAGQHTVPLMAVAFVASSKDATGWLLESCNYAERMAVGPTSEGWTQVLHYKLV